MDFGANDCGWSRQYRYLVAPTQLTQELGLGLRPSVPECGGILNEEMMTVEVERTYSIQEVCKLTGLVFPHPYRAL